MKMRKIRFVVVFAVGLLLNCQSASLKAPKNIILMISDGCGYNHILCTDYYQNGQKDSQVYAQFPVKLGMSTYPEEGNMYQSEKAWSDFTWSKEKYTDSAASGTAMATGKKTLNRYIGVSKESKVYKTVLEHAEEIKKSSGVVTSVPISHATPACFVAHHPNRKDYEIIAQQMLTESAIDVIMGCGHPYYDKKGHHVEASKYNYQYVAGKTLWEKLLQNEALSDADHDGINDSWKMIQKREEFQKLTKGDTPKRVLGIARVEATLNYERDGKENNMPYAIPLLESVPTLAEMSKAALNILDENDKGFFLMIEGGAVDWASHDHHLGRMIEEEIEFNKSVEAVVEWVENYSSWDETLVIVTADHETGYLTGPPESFKKCDGTKQTREWGEIKNPGKGNLLVVSWNSKKHSNHLVPFFAKGRGCEVFLKSADQVDAVRGAYIDNTDIGSNIFALWK